MCMCYVFEKERKTRRRMTRIIDRMERVTSETNLYTNETIDRSKTRA